MIEQFSLGLFSLAAVFFANCRTDHWRRWACICGICAQPFWFYATWHAQQWGIFGLSFVYAALWLRGFRIYWMPAA